MTPQIILEAFREAAEGIDEDFAQTVPTVSQAFEQLRTAFIEFLGEFNQSTGIIDRLARSIQSLAENIDTLILVIGAVGLVAVLRILPALLLGVSTVVLTTVSALRALTTGVATAVINLRTLTATVPRLTHVFSLLHSGGFGLFLATIRQTRTGQALRQLVVNLRAILAASLALVNPVTIIATLLGGVVVSAWLAWRDSVNETKEALDDVRLDSLNSTQEALDEHIKRQRELKQATDETTESTRTWGEVLFDVRNTLSEFFTGEGLTAILTDPRSSPALYDPNTRDQYIARRLQNRIDAAQERDRLFRDAGARGFGIDIFGRDRGAAQFDATIGANTLGGPGSGAVQLGFSQVDFRGRRIPGFPLLDPNAGLPIGHDFVGPFTFRGQTYATSEEYLRALDTAGPLVEPAGLLDPFARRQRGLQQRVTDFEQDPNRALRFIRARREEEALRGPGSIPEPGVRDPSAIIAAIREEEALRGPGQGTRAEQEAREFEQTVNNLNNLFLTTGDVIENNVVGAIQEFIRTGEVDIPAFFRNLLSEIAGAATRALVDELIGDVTANLAGSLARGIAGAATGFPGFQTGGSFIVGGAGGPDSQLVGFRASPGERVDVSTPDQQRQRPINVNVNLSKIAQRNLIRENSDEILAVVSENSGGLRNRGR